MTHAFYVLALAIAVLMTYQVGFDNGRDAANGVCKIVYYKDGNAR